MLLDTQLVRILPVTIIPLTPGPSNGRLLTAAVGRPEDLKDLKPNYVIAGWQILEVDPFSRDRFSLVLSIIKIGLPKVFLNTRAPSGMYLLRELNER